MITRRKFSLAGLFAAFGAATLDPPTVNADTSIPRIPPGKKQPIMPIDVILTRQEDMEIVVPFLDKNGSIPDIALITGAKISPKIGYGGGPLLADASLANGKIVFAYGTSDGSPSGTACVVATIRWTPAESIVYGDIYNQVTGVAVLHVQGNSLITSPREPFRILLMPSTTTGV